MFEKNKTKFFFNTLLPYNYVYLYADISKITRKPTHDKYDLEYTDK
jgi:hypothetical protein